MEELQKPQPQKETKKPYVYMQVKRHKNCCLTYEVIHVTQ